MTPSTRAPFSSPWSGTSSASFSPVIEGVDLEALPPFPSPTVDQGCDRPSIEGSGDPATHPPSSHDPASIEVMRTKLGDGLDAFAGGTCAEEVGDAPAAPSSDSVADGEPSAFSPNIAEEFKQALQAGSPCTVRCWVLDGGAPSFEFRAKPRPTTPLGWFLGISRQRLSKKQCKIPLNSLDAVRLVVRCDGDDEVQIHSDPATVLADAVSEASGALDFVVLIGTSDCLREFCCEAGGGDADS